MVINLDMITHIQINPDNSMSIHLADSVIINVISGISFLRLVKEIHPDIMWITNEPA